MPAPAPVAPKTFLTNQGENTLSKRLEKILPLTEDFDCLVGYFFISGFFRLYPALESVKKIRILIGLKNEQVVHGLIQIANDGFGESAPSTAEVKRTFGGMMRSELIQAQDSLAIETGIRKFIEWIRSDKLEVKLYREQNIHAKVYIMTPEHPVPDVNHGYVITGSSNLSHSGLEGNLEFNVLLAEPEEHDYALHRFNELWADAVDVKDVHETIITTVEKESPFAFFTPYELYLKFLADYFRDYLGDRSKLNTENLPQNFKKLQYQEDAVFTAQQMLKTYGGVFIADVVGLGKTYMSALLALQLDGRCLVIAPPSLLDENSPGSWPRVFRDFCIPGHKCVSIGKLEEVLEHGVEFYKYVFIDESQRFKSDSTQRYELLTRICQNKGVILVSATPYNNTLTDIYSQLKLFQPPRNSTIPGLHNLEGFFEKLQKRIEGLHRLDDAEAYVAAVKQNAQELRERVLKYVMVRRTRREIEEFYGDDLKRQKIGFPKVNDPIPLLYQLNRAESAVFTSTLESITSSDFHYARYQPLNPLYFTGPIEDRAVQGQHIPGIEGDLGPEHADTFRRDLHKDLKTDYVLANPPFHISDWHRSDEDVRWKYGLPPKGNANFAWVQHFIHHLSPSGFAGFHLLRVLDVEIFNAGAPVPTLNRNRVHKLPVVIARKPVVEAFDAQVILLMNQEMAKEGQSHVPIHDALIPILLSGEIHVDEDEQLVEAQT